MPTTAQELQQLQEKIVQLVKKAEHLLEQSPEQVRLHFEEAQALLEKSFSPEDQVFQWFSKKQEQAERKASLHLIQMQIRELFQQGKLQLKNDTERAEKTLQKAMQLAEQWFPDATKLKQRIHKLLNESRLRKLIQQADHKLETLPNEAFRLYGEALVLAKDAFPEAEDALGWLHQRRKKAEEITTSLQALLIPTSSLGESSPAQTEGTIREKTPSKEMTAVPKLVGGLLGEELSPSEGGISSVEVSAHSAPRASLQEIRKRALEAIQVQEAKLAETQSRNTATLKVPSGSSSSISNSKISTSSNSKISTSNPRRTLKGEVIAFVDGFAVIQLGDQAEQQAYLSPGEISWTVNYADAKHYFDKGVERTVEFVLLGADEDDRLLASLRRCKKDPWEEEIPSRFPIGTELEGEVIYSSPTYKNILLGYTFDGEEVRGRLLEPENHPTKTQKVVPLLRAEVGTREEADVYLSSPWRGHDSDPPDAWFSSPFQSAILHSFP